MSVSEIVLDTSAVLAVINGESGADMVTAAIADGVVISAVNWAELVSKLAEAHGSHEDIAKVIRPLLISVIPLDEELAVQAGLLRPLTRQYGLSLGDRACLALARKRQVPVLTADRQWLSLSLEVEIRAIR